MVLEVKLMVTSNNRRQLTGKMKGRVFQLIGNFKNSAEALTLLKAESVGNQRTRWGLVVEITNLKMRVRRGLGLLVVWEWLVC